MKKLKASLLIECSLGMFLLGIILTLSIQYWKVINYEKNLFVTEKKVHDIKIALEGYVVRYGFLPNAANNDIGIEGKNCIKGKIPYKTLGLSKEYLKDGFGNFFKFIVNENLTLNYHVSRQKKIVPIFMPSIYVYHDETVIWHRLYEFSEPYVVYEYDNFDKSKNINLYSNKKLIQLSCLECDRPFVPLLLYNKSDINNVITEFETSKKYYKVHDLVAWVIIFGKDNNQNSSLDIHLNKNVFFQTRFNLASSVKHATSTDFAYLSSVDNNAIKLKY